MKKLLILALCLAVMLAHASALAELDVGVERKVDDLVYRLMADGTWAVTGCSYSARSVSILPEVEGRPVTVINGAFEGCPNLEEVAIPEGITLLNAFSFRSCPALTHITLPASLTKITGNPFVCCEKLTDIQVAPDNPALEVVDGVLFNKLERRLICFPFFFSETEYVVPEGTRSIGISAFSLRGYERAQTQPLLRRVVIPEGVTVIEDYAFQGLSLDSLELPESLTIIGYYALPTNPSRMMTLSGNVAYISRDCLKNAITPFLVEPDSYALAYCRATDTRYVIRGSEAAESWRPLIIVNCDEQVSLRSEPSDESEALAQMPLYSLVEAQPYEGLYWFCRYRGQTGYVSAEYLELDD